MRLTFVVRLWIAIVAALVCMPAVGIGYVRFTLRVLRPLYDMDFVYGYTGATVCTLVALGLLYAGVRVVAAWVMNGDV